MLIDLHVHSFPASDCAFSTLPEQIESAIAFKLDAIAITEHDFLYSQKELADLNKRYAPFRIFSGVEVSIQGGDDHVVVLGVHDRKLETGDWTYENLWHFVRERDGYLFLCHPYRFRNEIVDRAEELVPDAIEQRSTNIGRDDESRIGELARRLNVPVVFNSDAHKKRHVGIYCNDIPGHPSDDRELILALRSGRNSMHCHPMRLEETNAEIRRRELRIRRMIDQGKTAEDYASETGEWGGHFDRVAAGRSYQI